MEKYKQYRRTQIAELRPYEAGEILPESVSISQPDKDAGSPKIGDMIARNPKNHSDKWLIAKQYFEDNFEPVPVFCTCDIPDRESGYSYSEVPEKEEKEVTLKDIFKCDVCGCHPSVVITTQFGTFCQQHAKYI